MITTDFGRYVTRNGGDHEVLVSGAWCWCGRRCPGLVRTPMLVLVRTLVLVLVLVRTPVPTR